MTTIPHPCLDVQTSASPHLSVPPWFAETVLIAGYLREQGILDALNQQVRLVRGRFGRYEVIDFLAVLVGYVLSGERAYCFVCQGRAAPATTSDDYLASYVTPRTKETL